MANESSTIVQRLWNYCNVLRDDGVSYGDYVEQLTYLLFLKMADEQTKPPFNKPSTIPNGLDWKSLLEKDGDALETHYRHILETLGKGKGMLGVIFRKSQNKIQDPAKLRRLIELINGAGQYFTPRPLIKAMVEVIRPEPGMTICDPASEKPWTEKLWIYDLRTNHHFTLKTNTLKYEDLADFIKCYSPENRFNRTKTERFKAFRYDELLQRDKVSLER